MPAFIIALLLATALVGTGCGSPSPQSSQTGNSNRQSPAVSAATETAAEVTSPQPATFISGTTSEDAPHYTVDMAYPVMHGGSDDARAAINASVGAYVATTTAGFKDYAKDYTPTPSDAKYTLQTGYGIPLNTEDWIALVFSGYEFTGGAHGMHIYETQVFDAKTGERATLDSLFASSTYLTTLSRLYADRLKLTDGVKSMSDDDWLKQGTDPSVADNYRYWYLAPDGLHTIFPPYQVAAYAAGDFDISIPYPELKGLLKPEVQSSLVK